VFLAPPLLFFAAFAIFPLLFTIYVSLNNWQISGNLGFVGLDNYAAILRDPTFTASLRNTLVFTLFMVSIEYVLGLGVALLVGGIRRGQRPIRLAVLMPMMLTPIVVGFIWKTILDPSFGPMDNILTKVGLPAIPWLSDPVAAFAGIVLVDVWEWTPFIFLILYAGLQSLPVEPFESARVDGASNWRIFWDLTFPMILPASIAAVLLRSIEAFKLFDIVYLITGGGPGVATSTLTLSAYFTGLRTGNLGAAAAMTVLLLLIVLAVTMIALQIVLRVTRRQRTVPTILHTTAVEGVSAQ
jgi:multiple sugar transport system permease protein